MLHELVQKELLNNKSLSALVYLIDHGRELEFSYNDTEYFISRDGSKKYVSLWQGQNEQCFDDMTELIEKTDISGKSLLDVWFDVCLGTLF